MENYCENGLGARCRRGRAGPRRGDGALMRVPSARLPRAPRRPRPGRGRAAHRRRPDAVPRHRALPDLLVPGSIAVVIGAGGLGHMAVQILRAIASATVIAVDQRQEALDLAVQVGADHGVVSGDAAVDEIRELDRGPRRRPGARRRGRRRHPGPRRRGEPHPRPPHHRRHRRGHPVDGVLLRALRGVGRDDLLGFLGGALRGAGPRPGGPREGPRRAGRPGRRHGGLHPDAGRRARGRAVIVP